MRETLWREGLRASFRGAPLRDVAARLIEIAEGGLERRGTCQTMRFLCRSTLTSVPHGGAVHGSPHGETSGSRRTA